MILRITVTVFFTFFILAQNQIYLYDTQDGLEIDYYDCRFVQSLDYCHRPRSPIDLIRDNDTLSCPQNNGTIYRFNELQLQRVNITAILQGSG